MSALRLARAFTRRDWIVKFSGCYHGHVDSLLVSAGSGAMTLGSPDSAGVPESWARMTLSLSYNDVASVENAFAQYGGRIAAVIIEPLAANMGVVAPREGFLKALREITRRHGALLIFDEVVTGFRLEFGGAQTLWKIEPDLTCLGKIIGGGFPIGAYGGRREIMEMVAPLGPVYQAGTLSGNPVAVAAGIACLETLRRQKPYARMARLASRLAEGLRRQASGLGVPLTVQQFASMLTPFFHAGPISDYASAKAADTRAYARFFHAMLREGIYLPPAQFEAAFLSAAHTEKDVDLSLRAAGRALDSLTRRT